MGQQKSSSTEPEISSRDNTPSKGFVKPSTRTMTTDADKVQALMHAVYEECDEDAEDILNNNIKPAVKGSKDHEKNKERSPTCKSKLRSRRPFSPLAFMQSTWSRLFSSNKKGRNPNRECFEKDSSPTSRIMRHIPNRKSMQSISRPISPEILSVQNLDLMESDRSLFNLGRRSGTTMLSSSRGEFHQVLEVNRVNIQDNRSNKRVPSQKLTESDSKISSPEGSGLPSPSSESDLRWGESILEMIDRPGEGKVDPGATGASKKRNLDTSARRREVFPSRCCGPSAPPVYLDYRLSSNRQGCGNRTSNPIMDKLKNVDVIEELNYYPPAETGCGDAESDDKEYYYMCNDCGELEPAPNSEKPKGSKKGQPTKPVTYSRRQRFNFKTTTNPDDDDGPPYKWPGSKGSQCRCPCCLAGLRRDPMCCCKCCCSKGRGRVLNSFDEIPVGKNPQPESKPSELTISSTDLEEEECEKLVPKQSGVYFYDADEKRFIRQVPRTPTPLVVKQESEFNSETEESELEQGIPRDVEEIIKSLPRKTKTQHRQSVTPITLPIIQGEPTDMRKLLGDATFMLNEDGKGVSKPPKLDNNQNQIEGYKQKESLPTSIDYTYSAATRDSSFSPKNVSRTRSTENDSDSTEGTGYFEATDD